MALPPMALARPSGSGAAPPAPHVYEMELRENDPRAAQPDKIRTPLKPHQAAALARALAMERDGIVYCRTREPPADEEAYNLGVLNPTHLPMGVQCNVGVLGDVPSYGKTLTALGIIAQNLDTTRIHCNDFMVSRMYNTACPMGGYAQFIAWRTAMLAAPGEPAHAAVPGAQPFIRSTLVVVPHGPVFMQWKAAVQAHTRLNVLFLDSITALRRHMPEGLDLARGARRELQADEVADHFAPLVRELERYDAVVFKSTCLKTFMDAYVDPYFCRQGCLYNPSGERLCHPFLSWGRVIVDEAHDLLPKFPSLRFKFLWLISATYNEIGTYIATRSRTSMWTMPGFLRGVVTPIALQFFVVKGARDFVVKSFTIPEVTEIAHVCRIEQQIAAIQEFLTPAVQDRVNAGDIHGAIQMMGGHTESEADLVELVTRELVRDLANRRRHEEFVRALEIPEADRNARLANLTPIIRSLEDRLAAIRERLTRLNEKDCEICGEPFVNPVFLSCTHVYCASCLMQWFGSPAGYRPGNAKSCPACRAPVTGKDLIAVGSPKRDRAGASGSASDPAAPDAAAPAGPLSKLDTLVRILRDNPEGRFLVFSRVDMTSILMRLAQEGIATTELKGTTGQMMNKLRAFENNEIRVILLNTRHAGSGIEITCATDVVLFHTMGQDAQQAIGRANRVGRTTSLRVHRLLYPHEQAQEAAAPPEAPAAPAPAPAPADAAAAALEGLRLGA